MADRRRVVAAESGRLSGLSDAGSGRVCQRRRLEFEAERRGVEADMCVELGVHCLHDLSLLRRGVRVDRALLRSPVMRVPCATQASLI